MTNHTIMTIAILGGTGKEGTGLARRWASAGYKVLIGSRQTEKAQTKAAEANEFLDIETVAGYQNNIAAQKADICVLTVVQAAQQAALEGLKEDLQGKVLIDATARVDFRDPKPPAPPAAARIAQEILGPGVKVVAAYQNVPHTALKKNLDQPLDVDVLICSDNKEAAQEAILLTEAAGMRGYHAGGLDNAIVVEGLTSVLIAMNRHYGGHASIKVTGLKKD